MWDRQTQSWWQQLTGEAIAGELAGRAAERRPRADRLLGRFSPAPYPDGLVLDRPTASGRYGSNPYVGYDALNSHPFLYPPPTDPRLPPKERVAAVEINGQAAAFPYSRLAEERGRSFRSRRRAGGRLLSVRRDLRARGGVHSASRRRRLDRRVSSVARRARAHVRAERCGRRRRVHGQRNRQRMEHPWRGGQRPSRGKAIAPPRGARPFLVRVGGLQAETAVHGSSQRTQ